MNKYSINEYLKVIFVCKLLKYLISFFEYC